MAKLSAHGQEIGRIFYTTYAKAYMADRKILKNTGSGWKLGGTLKDGLTPECAFQNAVELQRKHLSERQALAAYRKELHSMAGLCNRWKLHSAIQLLGNDYDGVWSEACDGYGDNVSASIDEVVTLCKLYEAAVIESQSLKQTETA